MRWASHENVNQFVFSVREPRSVNNAVFHQTAWMPISHTITGRLTQHLHRYAQVTGTGNRPLGYWHHRADERLDRSLQWSMTRLEDPKVSFGRASPWNVILSPFSDQTLLAKQQEGHPACKKLGVGLLVVTFWSELHMFYSSSCHHHIHHP